LRDSWDSLVRHPVGALARRDAGDLLKGSRDPAERPPEVRNVDQCKQQARHPEDVHVGEEGEQAQYGDDLELQFVGLVRHALGQGVQPQEQEADRQHGDHQKHRHDHHEDIGLAGRGDERWQVMRGGWM
jgi:hypothetical protein